MKLIPGVVALLLLAIGVIAGFSSLKAMVAFLMGAGGTALFLYDLTGEKIFSGILADTFQQTVKNRKRW